ncbi:MAG TPA: FAD-binding oxidoreductase [Conexibacter sp.]|nr:FAD-binding oxidoreductase [Conexibacter sp.]
MGAHPRRNGDVSFWDASLAAPLPRPALDGDRGADVCIVGAGFTGLWTAYHLVRARPELDVVVLERERVGFGASGRNGGWLTPALAAPPAAGPATAATARRAMHESVADVLAVCAHEQIACDALAGGVLRFAGNAAQTARLRAQVAAAHDEDELVALDAAALAARVRVAGARAATWSPHGVRIQPAKLARGLAEAAERRGVRIYERTTARELRACAPGTDRAVALTDRGAVRAPVVLRCLEGFTAGLRGERRTLLPLTSAMLVTQPLPDDAWAAIGWERAELLGDAAHAFLYAQRTADGRIALGGRGTYRYGSRSDRRGRVERRTVAWLAARLRELFPAAADAAIDHAWCGVIGVARDWTAAVHFDPRSGLGDAGAYVGYGVGSANLAGRTLRDLVLGQESELTRLPWVGHSTRRWEPEPLRWLGATGIAALYRAADRREAAGSARTSRLARAADLIAGR